MLTKKETIAELSFWKDRLIQSATAEYCCFILLVDPNYAFMEIRSILPPSGGQYEFTQAESEYAPPLFKEDSARSYAAYLIDEGWNVVCYCYRDNIIRTLASNLDLTLDETPTAVVRKKIIGDHPGYVNLPQGVGSHSQTRRISAAERRQRNAEMKEYREAGFPVREIAELYGLSYVHVCNLTK